jgi:lipopolysaccharide transport system permease protein
MRCAHDIVSTRGICVLHATTREQHIRERSDRLAKQTATRGQIVQQAIETVMRPNQRGLALNEAYARRELLYFLILRDIKVRYKQTVLGVAWAVLVPVVQVVIFSVIFGHFAAIKPDGDYPYPLFVLAGLVPWTFFSQSVTQAGQSLVNQQQMLTKVYFPRLFVPTGVVGGCFVDFAISFVVYAVAIAWYGFLPSWQVIFVPILALLTIIATLGTVYLLSALTVTYRDFRHIVPVLVQSLMYLSPVIYPVDLVPVQYRWLMGLNPLSGLIDGFRSAILGKPWDVPTLLTAVASAFALLFIGAWYFRATERRFADIA